MYIIILIAIDLLSKFMATVYLNKPFYITNWLVLYTTTNKGIAFSLFASSHFISQLFMGTTAIIICLLIKNYLKTDNYIMKTAKILIVSGGIGNGLNRIFALGVTDFIGFNYYINYFISFNLADIFLTIGSFLILYNSFIKKPLPLEN